MTRELTNLCKRVNKGAKFLDKVHPGWHKEINLDQLRLGNSKQCLLGSLYNDFYWGLDALKLNGEEAIKYGFILKGMDIVNKQFWNCDLQQCWLEEIEERQ